MDVQVKIELGHRATPRAQPTKEGYTHDWTVYVRGPDSCNIAHFVEKVVFVLHPSFADPIRVCKEPPYHVAEKGYASFEFPIEIHFRNKSQPRSLKYKYNLLLHMHEPVNSSRCEKLTFHNPTDEFKKKLIKGGGTVIRHPEEMQFTSLFGPPIKTTESPKKPKQPTVASKEKPPRLSLDDSSKPASGKSKDKESSSSKSSSSNKSDDGHVTKERSHKDKHSSKDTSRKHTDSPSLSSSGSSGKRYSESPTNHEQAKKLKRSSSSSSFPDKKSKEKDRDAEREKQKELEREREKEAEKARKEAEKEREKERLKELERERERESHREMIAKEKEAARQKEIEKEKARELAREREREEKEREKKEQEKEKMKEKERQRRKEKKEKEKLNSKSEKSSKSRHSSSEKPKNRDKESLNESSHKQKSPITDIEVKKRDEIDEKPKSISHSKTDSPSRSVKKEDHKKTDKSQSDKYYSKTKVPKESSKPVKSEKPHHKEKIKEKIDPKVIAHKKNLESEIKPPKTKKSDDSIASYRNKLSNVTISELKNDLSGSDSSDSLSVSSLSSSSVPGSDSGSDNESEGESVSSKSRKSSSSSKASTPRKSALGTLFAELEEDDSEDDIPEPGSVFSTHSAGSRHSPSRSLVDNKAVFSNHSSGSRPSPSQHEDNKPEKNGHRSKLSPGQRYTKDKHSSDADKDETVVKSPKKRARVSSKDKSAINTSVSKHPNSGVLTHSESKGFDVYNHYDDHLSPGSQRSSVGIADEAPQELMESQNGEELTELVALQRKLMSIKDPNILVKVVMLIQRVGKFKIGEASTFDFDLCSLDSSTVQEIRTYIGQA